jgi:hypothetical protein
LQERDAVFSRFLFVLNGGVDTLKMSQDDLLYYERRAEAEIAAAQQARHQAVVQAHYELASAYLDRIHGNEPKSSGGLFNL